MESSDSSMSYALTASRRLRVPLPVKCTGVRVPTSSASTSLSVTSCRKADSVKSLSSSARARTLFINSSYNCWLSIASATAVRIAHVEHNELWEMLDVEPVGRAGDCIGKLRAPQCWEPFADIEDLETANRIRLV